MRNIRGEETGEGFSSSGTGKREKIREPEKILANEKERTHHRIKTRELRQWDCVAWAHNLLSFGGDGVPGWRLSTDA